MTFQLISFVHRASYGGGCGGGGDTSTVLASGLKRLELYSLEEPREGDFGFDVVYIGNTESRGMICGTTTQSYINGNGAGVFLKYEPEYVGGEPLKVLRVRLFND